MTGMKTNQNKTGRVRMFRGFLLLLFVVPSALADQPPASLTDSPRILRAEIKMLRKTIAAQQVEIARLKRQLAKARQHPTTRPAATSRPASRPTRSAKATAYLAECERQRLAAIAETKAEIKSIAATMRPGGGRSRADIEGRQAIKNKRKRLKDLETNDPPYRAKLAVPLKVGAIGALPREPRCSIQQVIGVKDMLVKVTVGRNFISSSPREVRFLTRAPGRGPGRYTDIRQLVWIRGVPTTGLVDKSGVQLPQAFEITGTKTYETTSGSNTVHVLEPFDPDD